MQGPLIETLARQGVSRRTFSKYCATLASMMALSPAAGQRHGVCTGRDTSRHPAPLGYLVAVPGMHRLHRIDLPITFAHH
jgi:hypothetical protein